MPNTGLKGSYELTAEGIDDAVTKTSPGVYVLGYRNSKKRFVVRYVGRSDDDVNGRLHQWVGKRNYKRFKFGYYSSPKAAFEKECSVYHDFGGPGNDLDNDIHPDRPEGQDWVCPVCDVFDE